MKAGSRTFWKQPWFQGNTCISPRKSRWILNLISKNSSGAFWKQLWFQGNSWIFPWFQVNLKSTLIKKKNSSDTFSKQPWFQGNLNFSRVHNVSFAGSGAFHVPQRICKVNTIKLVCCNRQFFYLVSDASKPDWKK